MPAQYTLPPDTRAVGTGNPPADVNAHTDALQAIGATLNVLNAAYSGGADPTGVADSTAAFQACITAAIATGAEMVIPAGTYNIASTLHITGPFKMRGLGACLSNTNGFFLTAAVTLNGPTGSSSMFDHPFQGYLWGGLEIQGLVINYTGTGDVFHNLNFTDAVFRDMSISLTAGGSMAFTSSGTASVLSVLYERVNIATYANVRTNPMMNITSSNSGAISNNTHFKCKFSNLGFDKTQPMMLFSCTFAGNGFHYADNFIDCWFEHPYGGAYTSLSGMGIKVDGCSIWDAFTGNGASTTVAAGSNGGTLSGIAAWANPSAGVLSVASTTSFPTSGTLTVATTGGTGTIAYTGITPTTFTGCTYTSGTGTTVTTGGAVNFPVSTAKSFYYFGAGAGNSGSFGTRVSGCSRNLGGPDGSTCWDVECEATSSQVQVENYVIKPGTVSTYTPAYFNFHGCNDVILINNQSAAGASINGNSDTQITLPSPTQTVISKGLITAPSQVSVSEYQPADYSYAAYAFDPALMGAGTSRLITLGTRNLIGLQVRGYPTVSIVDLYVATAGTVLTSGQCLIGLYNSAGTLIGLSADQSAVWNSTGPKTGTTLTVQGGQSLSLTPGLYWIALLANGTTAPGFTYSPGQNNIANFYTNARLGVSSSRYATNGAGLTSLTALTPSSNVQQQLCCWWVGLG